MSKLKTKLCTISGAFIFILGVVCIILPGPAILFIPLGLMLMSFEYPIAKNWLRKYQRYSKKAAVKTDSIIRNRRFSR